MYHELGDEARSLDDTPLALIERFHGHVGPYVVLGYLSGRLAQERLGVNAFKMTVEVSAGLLPPMSCFADGVQLGSGCTLGKGNIVLDGQELVEARFTSEEGRHLRVRVRPEVLEGMRSSLDSEALVRISEELIGATPEELFQIEEG